MGLGLRGRFGVRARDTCGARAAVVAAPADQHQAELRRLALRCVRVRVRVRVMARLRLRLRRRCAGLYVSCAPLEGKLPDYLRAELVLDLLGHRHLRQGWGEAETAAAAREVVARAAAVRVAAVRAAAV